MGPGAEFKAESPGLGAENPDWSVREPMTDILEVGWSNKLRWDYHEPCYALGLEKRAAEWKKWKRRQANAIAARKRAQGKPKKKAKAILEVKPRKPKSKRKADA